MLKVKFWRIENVVLMKVLEQGDEIERGLIDFFDDKVTNINLSSDNRPRIFLGFDDTRHIYVRGKDDSSDYNVVSIDFDTIADAKEFYHNAIKTIKDYNKYIKSKPISNQIESTIAE